MTHENLRVVLCGASKYEEKYYFNKAFDKLPDSVKDELHILCVQFTEEVGGIFTIVFTPEGDVEMETQCEEGDLLYDEIGCGLTVKSLRRSKQELFQSLSVYYKVMILHMDPSALISDDDEVDVNDPSLMNNGYTALGEESKLDDLSRRLRAEADPDATEVKTTFASSDCVSTSSTVTSSSVQKK